MIAWVSAQAHLKRGLTARKATDIHGQEVWSNRRMGGVRIEGVFTEPGLYIDSHLPSAQRGTQ